MLMRLQLRFYFICLLFLIRAMVGSLGAQSWDFIKEQDGIRVFTRQEAGKSLKAYRGTASIHAPADKIFALIEDANHTEWWDKSISPIKVLAYEKNRRAQYYLVYNAPWPVSDRELYVDATVTIDREKGVYSVTSVPLAVSDPEHEERVRIRDYRQTWTVTSTGDHSAQVVLEGYADPAGNIPAWIGNMLITQSPLSVILGVRQQIEKQQHPF